jgi:hypothetical protein
MEVLNDLLYLPKVGKKKIGVGDWKFLDAGSCFVR